MQSEVLAMDWETLQHNFAIMETLPEGAGVYLNQNRIYHEDRLGATFRRKLNSFGVCNGFHISDVEKMLKDMVSSIDYYHRHEGKVVEIYLGLNSLEKGWKVLCGSYYKNNHKAKELQELFHQTISQLLDTYTGKTELEKKAYRASIHRSLGPLVYDEQVNKLIEQNKAAKQQTATSHVLIDRASQFQRELEGKKRKKEKKKEGSKWQDPPVVVEKKKEAVLVVIEKEKECEELKAGITSSPSMPQLGLTAKWRQAEWLQSDSRRHSLSLRAGMLSRRLSQKTIVFDEIGQAAVWKSEVGNHNNNIVSANEWIKRFLKEEIYVRTDESLPAQEALHDISSACSLAKYHLEEAHKKVKQLDEFIRKEIISREYVLNQVCRAYDKANAEYSNTCNVVEKLNELITRQNDNLKILQEMMENAKDYCERMDNVKKQIEQITGELSKETLHRNQISEEYCNIKEKLDNLKSEYNAQILLLFQMDSEFNKSFEQVRSHFTRALDLYEAFIKTLSNEAVAS